MSDFDHIGTFITATFNAAVFLFFVSLLAVPLAIWKIVDIVMWLFS
jgi:hypothetical protein